MIPTHRGGSAHRRFGSATRLAAFLALLLAAILSITAFETERVFANQSMAATTRSLVSEVDSYEKAASGTAGPGLAATTISYLQSRVLPQGETIMVELSDGRKLGSAGSAPLLRTQTIQAMLGRPPPSPSPTGQPSVASTRSTWWRRCEQARARSGR